MMSPFTPLETDVSRKDLVYASKAKLDGFLLAPETFGGGLQIVSTGANVDSRQKGQRELLNEAGKLLAEQQKLCYEDQVAEGKWLLVRAIMVCGTAWPWAGNTADAAKDTAWWVGNSESLRILAYGHRSHLLGEGLQPSASRGDTHATWWPSRSDAYNQLLSRIGISVNEETPEGPQFDADSAALANLVEGIDNAVFSQSGLFERDAPALVKTSLVEILLRVDRVVRGKERTTVLGSPLWVARAMHAPPGTYSIVPFNTETGQETFADWDGLRLSNPRQAAHRLAPNAIDYFSAPLSGKPVDLDLAEFPNPKVDALVALASSHSVLQPVEPSAVFEGEGLVLQESCARCWWRVLIARILPGRRGACRVHA